MKATLYVGLAGFLVMLPVDQVLAQAEQQDSTTPEASVVRELGPQPVLRIPALVPETPRPWQSFAEKPRGMFAEPSLSTRDAVPAPAWSDWSDEKKLLVVIAIGVGLLLIL